jgi:hypothetical protein
MPTRAHPINGEQPDTSSIPNKKEDLEVITGHEHWLDDVS